MKHLDFIDKTNLNYKAEPERAKLVCYYDYKENKTTLFSMSDISKLLQNFGYSKPNISRLKEKLIKGKDKAFIVSNSDNNKIEFLPTLIEVLDKNYGNIWNDTDKIESSSELLDENKFCGKRGFLTRLIKQINACYKDNCYDACAVLMRRLFEVVLVLSFQHNKIDNLIKDTSNVGYLMLEQIVKVAQCNTTLNLSRNKLKYDLFRQIGNFSAHSITYIASVKDIDDIKIDDRVMLEELYNKSGII